MRSVAILGATGSIGGQALDIIEKHPDQFRAAVLTAYASAEQLFEAARRFRPQAAGLVVPPPRIPPDLKGIEWFFGPDCSQRALEAARPQDALCAVVGVAGLGAVLTAAQVCERVLLANKEALVTGGRLVLEAAKAREVALLPVDSEHSAIFQCLQGAGDNRPVRLILTASGGALRDWPRQAIESATPAQVLAHPTWRMGGKITVDCASMMNKGLELIEAHYLFGMAPDALEAVVHPQSVIHSMVEFADGAVLAQLGAPDMRTAIGYAMGYPHRVPYGGQRLDFAHMGALTFQPPDEERFPCLALAKQALRAGEAHMVALNGANEAAVARFLQGRLPFGGIARTVAQVLERTLPGAMDSPEAVLEADARARTLAEAAMAESITE